jgi:predicted dehydrogenase
LVHIGIIGCGKIAEKHLQAYRKLDGVEVTVTDVVDRGRLVADRYEVGWCGEPEEVVLSDRVDAIDICVPTPSHADFIARALAARKHVFVEKPLASNLEEARAIAELAAETDLVVMAGYLYRHHPAMQFARDVIRSGAIGMPYLAMFRIGGRGSHKAWKHQAETGGGAANEMLVHMLDLALWYFGEPVSATNLFSDVLLPTRVIEGEAVSATADDFNLLKLEMANGATVICQSDLVTPGYMNHIEVQGTNGSLMASILDYMPTVVYCKEPVANFDRGQNFRRFPETDLFERELGHFVASVRGGDTSDTHSVLESLRLMELMEATAADGKGTVTGGYSRS